MQEAAALAEALTTCVGALHVCAETHAHPNVVVGIIIAAYALPCKSRGGSAVG